MTRRTHLDVQILAERGAGREFVAAAADDFDVGVVRMNLWFHDRGSERGAREYCPEGAEHKPGLECEACVGLSTKSVNNSVESGRRAIPYPRAQRISLVLVKKRSN